MTIKEIVKEKDAQKNFQIMSNMLFVVIIFFMILYALSFVLAVIHAIQSASAYSYLSETGRADFIDYYSCRIIDCLTMTIVTAVGFDIFRRFKRDNTPFVPYIGKGLRIIAIAMFVGFILIFSAHIFADVIAGAAPPHEYSGSINVSSMIMVSMFIMLSYIFDYGCKLQKESDETL